MKNETVKIKNNAGKVIEVTKLAWEILYEEREGFSLYIEEKSTAKKTSKKTTKREPSKKVTKDDKSN